VIRECTAAENKVLKECAADVLADPVIYKNRCRINILAMVIELLIGVIFGWSFTAWIYSSGGDRASEKMVFVCTSVAVAGVCMFLWNTLTERMKHKMSIQGEKFRINGGTVINYTSVSKKKAYIIFTEDDLTDAMGRPFCIKYPALPGLQIRYGERIILAYGEKDAYIPLKISGHTNFFVPGREPESFYKTNWNEVLCLPHPEGLDMDRSCIEMSSEESLELMKKAGAIKANRALKWTGNVLLSVILLLLAVIIYIVFINKSIYEELGSAAQIMSVMMPVYLFILYLVCKVNYNARVKKTGKMLFKKKVLFHSIEMKSNGSSYMPHIFVYEYRNGAIELVAYPFMNNAFGLKDLPYGKLLYKYEKQPNNDKKNLIYFSLT